MMDSQIRGTDALTFLAELGVYVAVPWWGFTRDVPVAIRGLLGVVGIVVFAATWAIFAAPKASRPLQGMANVVFRIAWFGFGGAAGLILLLSR